MVELFFYIYIIFFLRANAVVWCIKPWLPTATSAHRFGGRIQETFDHCRYFFTFFFPLFWKPTWIMTGTCEYLAESAQNANCLFADSEVKLVVDLKRNGSVRQSLLQLLLLNRHGPVPCSWLLTLTPVFYYGLAPRCKGLGVNAQTFHPKFLSQSSRQQHTYRTGRLINVHCFLSALVLTFR